MPRILVVGSETWTDTTIAEQVIERAYLRVRQASGSTPMLVTMGRTEVERFAESWWKSHGMLVEMRRPFKSKYVHVHTLVEDAPDLMLIFGADKVTERALEGAARGVLDVVEIKE